MTRSLIVALALVVAFGAAPAWAESKEQDPFRALSIEEANTMRSQFKAKSSVRARAKEVMKPDAELRKMSREELEITDSEGRALLQTRAQRSQAARQRAKSVIDSVAAEGTRAGK